MGEIRGRGRGLVEEERKAKKRRFGCADNNERDR